MSCSGTRISSCGCWLCPLPSALPSTRLQFLVCCKLYLLINGTYALSMKFENQSLHAGGSLHSLQFQLSLVPHSPQPHPSDPSEIFIQPTVRRTSLCSQAKAETDTGHTATPDTRQAPGINKARTNELRSPSPPAATYIA